MATMAPKGSAFYNIVKEMGNEWKTVSNNQVRLKIYPGGVAGSDVDVVRKMKLGTVNAGLITSTGLATVHKAVNAFQLPATYRTPAELDYVVSKLGDEVARLYEENGMIVLSWGEAGWIRFLSKSPMMDPSDRAQHKMFIVAGNKGPRRFVAVCGLQCRSVADDRDFNGAPDWIDHRSTNHSSNRVDVSMVSARKSHDESCLGAPNGWDRGRQESLGQN